MKKNKLLSPVIFNSFLCVVALAVTLFLIITGPYIQEGYDLKVGSLSPKLFIAPSDIKDEYATDKLIDAAIASVGPLYKQDITIEEPILQEINDFLIQEKLTIDKLKAAEFEAAIDSSVNPDGSDPTESPNTDVVQIPEPASKIAVSLTDEQFNLLKNKTDAEYEMFSEQVLELTKRFFDRKIAFDENTPAKTAFDLFISDEEEAISLNEDDIQLLKSIAAPVIKYSFVMDEDATLSAKNEAAAKVTPIIILKGQKIIDEREPITEHVYAILDSLNYVNKTDFTTNFLPILGVSLIVLLIFAGSVFYLFTFYKKRFENKTDTLLLFTLYIVVIAMSRLMVTLPYMYLPVLAFTMLVAMLLSSRCAIILNVSLSFLCMLIYKGDLQFFTYFALTGIFTPVVTRYTTERNGIVVAGLFNSVIGTLMIIGITLFFEKSVEAMLLNNIVYAFSSGLVTLVLAAGSLPFWEAVFGIVTPIKLLEIINPNSKLIRRLMLEAPGTYHHSLIVANLAEAAAYDVGANAVLARVGGYYHDIGKLKYPQYFSENIITENLHDYINPKKSADVITSHVTAGIELAESYKVPKSVIDIIAQHHGNSQVKFFLHKAKSINPENAVNEDDFRYKFETPKTKEAAIVMLADTVEAAVRSVINSKDFTEVDNFVRSLIRDKLNDGQLNDSMLTIKDLDIISKSFMDVFKGMYHERIPYPDDKDEKKDEGQA